MCRRSVKAVVAGRAAVEAAGLVVVLVEGVEVSGWWSSGAGRALVGLVLLLSVDLPWSSRGQRSWSVAAAGAAEVREEGRGHHPSRLWCCGAPSGLRSLFLLPWPLGIPEMPAVLGATKKCAYPY
jgi:hypothetical protein